MLNPQPKTVSFLLRVLFDDRRSLSARCIFGALALHHVLGFDGPGGRLCQDGLTARRSRVHRSATELMLQDKNLANQEKNFYRFPNSIDFSSNTPYWPIAKESKDLCPIQTTLRLIETSIFQLLLIFGTDGTGQL